MMKRFHVTAMGLFLTMFVSLHALAYDFEVNGLYYNVVSLENLTCEVSSPNEKDIKYSGIINIPSEVDYKGKKLDVIGIGNSAFYDCENFKGGLVARVNYFDRVKCV